MAAQESRMLKVTRSWWLRYGVAVLAVLLLAEPVTLRLLFAGAFMGFGLYLHLTERRSHEDP